MTGGSTGSSRAVSSAALASVAGLRELDSTATRRPRGTGWVASAGAHIFLGAEKERRLCLPNTRFLLHQPAGGMRGQASDIQIEAEQIIRMRDRVNRMIAVETGQSVERIVKDTQRNFWMNAEEAVDYGIVSRIIKTTAEV